MMNFDKTGPLGAAAGPAGGMNGPRATEGKAPEDAASVQAAGAAFRALMERLEKTAEDLDTASQNIEDPRQLGQVVENARASVQEAVLAGSDLLEAYRAAQARTTAEPPAEPPTEPTGNGPAQAKETLDDDGNDD